MLEIYDRICEIAKEFAMVGHFVCDLISIAAYILAFWYLGYILRIPFYLKEIAENTRRGR